MRKKFVTLSGHNHMEEEDFPNFSLEFNFPSIQETAEKPNEQQQQARRFPSLQEEALSLVILQKKCKMVSMFT